MKFLFRWAFRLFLVFLVLAVALVLVKDALLKSLVEHRIRSETGMDVKIGKLALGLFTPTLTIEELKLYNTAEFGGSPLIDLPELHFESDSTVLASRQLRFKLVRVHLREVNIVESNSGQTNIVGLVAGWEKLTSTNHSETSSTAWKFAGIETLNFSLGKLKYLSMKKPSKVTEVQLDVKNEIVTNVKSLDELTGIVINVLLRKGITIAGDPPNAPRPLPPEPHKKLEVTGKAPARPPTSPSRK